MAAQGVSGRVLAGLAGISEAAIRKARNTGRIQPLADGSYDADAALQALSRNGDPARTKVREPANLVRTEVRSPVRTEADAAAAVAVIRRVLEPEGAVVDEIRFPAARTADTILKAYQRDLAMAQKRKELVPLIKVMAHVDKAFIGYRQAIQRLPSRHAASMAAELGCEAAALDAALTKAIAAELNELSAPVVRA